MVQPPRHPLTIEATLSLIVIGAGIGWLIGLSISPVISIVIASVTSTAAALIAAMSGLKQTSEQKEAKAEKKTEAKAKDTPPLIIQRWQISPIPFALLIVGLIFGSISGLITRNQALFGSDVSIEIEKWSVTEYSEKDIARRIFDTQYPDYTQQPQIAPDLSAEIAKWSATTGYTSAVVAQRLFDIQYPVSKPGVVALPTPRTVTAGGSILFALGTEECDQLYAASLRSEDELISALESDDQLAPLVSIVIDHQTLKEIVQEVLCP